MAGGLSRVGLKGSGAISSACSVEAWSHGRSLQKGGLRWWAASNLGALVGEFVVACAPAYAGQDVEIGLGSHLAYFELWTPTFCKVQNRVAHRSCPYDDYRFSGPCL